VSPARARRVRTARAQVHRTCRFPFDIDDESDISTILVKPYFEGPYTLYENRQDTSTGYVSKSRRRLAISCPGGEALPKSEGKDCTQITMHSVKV